MRDSLISLPCCQQDAEYDKDGCEFVDDDDVPEAEGETGSAATTPSADTAGAAAAEEAAPASLLQRVRASTQGCGLMAGG